MSITSTLGTNSLHLEPYDGLTLDPFHLCTARWDISSCGGCGSAPSEVVESIYAHGNVHSSHMSRYPSPQCLRTKGQPASLGARLLWGFRLLHRVRELILYLVRISIAPEHACRTRNPQVVPYLCLAGLRPTWNPPPLLLSRI